MTTSSEQASSIFFSNPDFKRGRYGWAVIELPEGGTDLYRRASSMSNHLDDKQGLIDWNAAMVAKGMSKDQALLANFSILDWKEDKAKIKEMLGKAKDLGGGSAAADMGTAFHAVVEKHLQGRPIAPSDLPPGFQDSLDATITYLRNAGFEVVGTEVRVVDDRHRIAGTADLILRATRDIETPHGTIKADAIIIGDLKTGSVSDYSGLGMSMQLGIYAHSQPYDVAAGTRISWPGGHTPEEIGLILKVDLEAGTVEPWWLDLAGGYANVEHAFTIQEVRKNARKLIAKGEPSTAPTPAPESKTETVTTEEKTVIEDPWKSTGNAQIEDQAPAPKEKTRAEQIAEEAAGLANVGEARECYKKWRRAGAPAEEIKVILERAAQLGATMKGQ